MKLRDTVILVVLAHVGLVLIWICMGGCANDKAQEPEENLAVVEPGIERAEMPPVATEESVAEAPTPVTMAAQEDNALPVVTLPTFDEPTPEPVPEETVASEGVPYVVKKGDTLWAIGREFGVSINAIVERNDIQDPAMIRPGRELMIPVGSAPAARPRVESEVSEARAEASPSALLAGSEALPVADGGETEVYKVQSGDTIWLLARKYNTTSDKIMAANNISDATRLQIGQELRIPKGE
jgi:LysM repeat protein